ncbi:High mobility group [Borealophlyctis nickersoniae]|nr:High mobility group [Borealophlyctis nickersoniae]
MNPHGHPSLNAQSHPSLNHAASQQQQQQQRPSPQSQQNYQSYAQPYHQYQPTPNHQQLRGDQQQRPMDSQHAQQQQQQRQRQQPQLESLLLQSDPLHQQPQHHHPQHQQQPHQTPTAAPVKQKKIRDPNAPKAPLSSYLLFCQDARLRLREQHPDWSQKDVVKEMGRQWKEIGNEDKKEYHERALRLREEYNHAMSLYKDRGPGGTSPSGTHHTLPLDSHLNGPVPPNAQLAPSPTMSDAPSSVGDSSHRAVRSYEEETSGEEDNGDPFRPKRRKYTDPTAAMMGDPAAEMRMWQPLG